MIEILLQHVKYEETHEVEGLIKKNRILEYLYEHMATRTHPNSPPPPRRFFFFTSSQTLFSLSLSQRARKGRNPPQKH